MMVRTSYSYPATLEPDEDGRLVVHFADLPEALTDGADEAEALCEAADCLSEALASRIVDGEEIPAPSSLASSQRLVSPDPTIALKAALYEALRQRDMTVADLAERLDVDWHQAARLIDPRRSSKLTSLSAALGAMGCRIAISVEAAPAKPAPAADQLDELEIAERVLTGFGGKADTPERQRRGRPARTAPAAGGQRRARGGQPPPSVSLSDATLQAVKAHSEGATATEILNHLSREFGMTIRPNHLGIALQRHRRSGQLENRDQRWYPSSSAVDAPARPGSAVKNRINRPTT
jgi:antitoxin HicB